MSNPMKTTKFSSAISNYRHVACPWMFAAAAALGVTACVPAYADLAIETETARLVQPGHFEAGAALELQTSPNGKEYAVPLAFEFGVSKRLEVLIEPVPVTSIRPPGSAAATGFGDVETTLTYLLRPEKLSCPALALGGEIKIPTAHNRQIGSGKFDYRLYGIASKRMGQFDLHANLGYNIIGAPAGVRTRNPLDLELAAEWFVNKKFNLFAEVTYVGSSFGGVRSTGLPPAGGGGAGGGGTPGGEGPNSIFRRSDTSDNGGGGLGVSTPEVAGKEVVGSIGLRTRLTNSSDFFSSFSYDNNRAKLLRTGVAWRF